MSESVLSNSDHFFEDYVPGAVEEYGPILVEDSEVTEFANQFGPGSWRSEQRSGENGDSQKRIASEWLVVGLMMRVFVQHFLSSVASIASPGVDEIRWEKAVRAGDELRVRVTVVEARRSVSKPDRGMVKAFIETFNQNGELVLTLKSMNLIRRREFVSSAS